MSATAKRIAIAVLSISFVFFPSLFAELCTVDDLDMYKWLLTSETSFKDLFFPQASEGGYYRPLIGVSYLFDKYVWLLDTRLMHLDNLFFHIVNALLVYYLAFLLLPRAENQKSNVPLVASLLFGLHPLTTESVAWISGRTDIMACTFVLFSTVFLLRQRETGKLSNLLLAVLVLIPGLLIKETPLAFMLGAIFILSAKKENSFEISADARTSVSDVIRCAAFAGVASVLLIVSYNVLLTLLCGLAYLLYELARDRKAGRGFNLQTLSLITAGILLPIGLLFLVRKVVFTSNISSVGRTIKLILVDLNYASQTFFGAAGFYFRKFFFPFPLNFAIREVDPLYNAAGVALFFLCLFAIRRRSINSALFLAGVCLFLPALPLSLGTVTWTAYAERYIYMSISFWALAVSLWFGKYFYTQRLGRRASACIAVLLIFMGVSTWQRSMVWRTNLGLLSDTVKKSPGFKLILVDYMAVLMGHGDLEGAKEQYRIAKSIPSVGYMAAFDINMAAILVAEGKHEEADKLYNHVLEKTRGKSAVAYAAYVSYLQERYATSLKKNDGSCTAVGLKLIKHMEELNRLNNDPFLLYRSGQLALTLGRCDDALRLFTKAKNSFSAKSDYARISARLVDQLVSGHCRQVPL